MSDTFLTDEEVGYAEYLNVIKLIEEKQYGDGYTKLIELTQKYPKLSRSFFSLGWIYFYKLTDYHKAEECLKKAIELEPTFQSAYYTYFLVLSDLGRYDDLKKILELSLKVDGINKGIVYNEYGLMYEMKQDFDKAINYFQKGIVESSDINALEKFQTSIARCDKKKEILKK